MKSASGYPLLAGTLALLLAAAGCVGTDAEKPEPAPIERAGADPPAEDAPAEEMPASHTAQLNGSVTGVGQPTVGWVAPQGENRHEFEVMANVTALVVEVWWDAPVQLDVQVEVPVEYCEPADPVGLTGSCNQPEPATSGTSPARIVVTDAAMLAQTGTWTLSVWARDAPGGATFTAYATTFHGTPPTNVEAWSAKIA